MFGKEGSGVLKRLGRRQHIKAKCLSKPDWETMDSDLKRRGGKGTSIACETLRPTESPMGPLRSGLHVRRRLSLLSHGELRQAKDEQNGLGSQEVEPPSPNLAAFPISP